MKRKEKELCSSDSLLFRMNALGTRLSVNSAFALLLILSYRRLSLGIYVLDMNKRTIVFSCARLVGDKVI
jgi:hypothetical protein